jgi:hypothetical protein
MIKEIFYGKQVTISGKVEEHLVLGKKEWFTIRLENNQIITINRKLCTESSYEYKDTD